MNTQHFFISSAAVPVPERWREAFPDGKALQAKALQASLQGKSATVCMVWLASADAQWSVYLHQIRKLQPGARVVLLSAAPEPLEGLRALDQGVRGYTHAYAVPTQLQEVAMVIEHGGLWVGPDLLQRLVGSTHAALARRPERPEPSAAANALAANPWAMLSAREAQVARQVLAGRCNKEVAASLFISERTVKAHLGAVFGKLAVRDRLQLVLRLSAWADPGPLSDRVTP